MNLITKFVDSMTSNSPLKERKKARGLIFAKILYFSTSMGNVAWNRFQNLFFLDKGIHPQQIGQLKSLGLVLKFFGEPFWCFIADCTDPKIVFAICIVTQLFSMEIYRNVIPLTLSVIIAVKFIRTAAAPSTTLTTMATFKLTEGTKEGFGEQRMFGSLAWGVGAFVVGSLIDAFGMKAIFYFTYFFQCVSLLIVWHSLPKQTHNALSSTSNGNGNGKEKDVDVEGGGKLITTSTAAKSLAYNNETIKNTLKRYLSVSKIKFGTYWSEINEFLKNRACNFLLFNATCTGIIQQVIETYFFISVKETMHYSDGFSGLCTCIGSFSCAIVFYFSSQLIEKFGHGKCILTGECMYLFRLCALSLVPYNGTYSKHILLLIHTLAGPCFGLFWSASVDAVHKQSPKHLGTSCMGTMSMFYNILGACIGSLTWGYVYAYFGGLTFKFYLLAICFQCYTVKNCLRNCNMLDRAMDEVKSAQTQNGNGDSDDDNDDDDDDDHGSLTNINAHTNTSNAEYDKSSSASAPLLNKSYKNDTDIRSR